MIIKFTQLDSCLDLSAEHISVLQVENKTLFSKIVYSFTPYTNEATREPFLLLEDKKEVSLKDKLVLVSDPIILPLQNRQIETKLHSLFDALFCEDEELRSDIESLNEAIKTRMEILGLQLQGDYGFGIEWDTKKYLKAFNFGIENESETLFDNLIVFLKTFSDLSPDKGLVFINLKSFFEEKHLKEFYSEIISLNLSVLLLESVQDERVFDQESKTAIDQHFLES